MWCGDHWVALVPLGHITRCPCTRKLAIHLRRSNMRVTQQFLHRTQLHTILQHHYRKRVPQHMWGEIRDTRLARIPLDNQPETLPC